MAFFGSVSCPSCGCPLEADACVCPYCHSTSPASAPWQGGSWVVASILAAILLGVWACDHFYGTQFLESLRAMTGNDG